MDKINTKYFLPSCLVVMLDEIVDWINARDGQDAKTRTMLRAIDCAVEKHKAEFHELTYGQQEHTTSGEHRRMNKLPTIEQELEAGLEELPPLERESITRIFLPAAKYEELIHNAATYIESDITYWSPHGGGHIPIYGVPCLKKIIYCTD